jgi:hypothetical protein
MGRAAVCTNLPDCSVQRPQRIKHFKLLILLAYDLVGNLFRAAWRPGRSKLTRPNRKKIERKMSGGKAEQASGRRFYRKFRDSL